MISGLYQSTISYYELNGFHGSMFFPLFSSPTLHRLHSGRVNQMEEDLAARIGQVLLRYPFISPSEESPLKADCDNLKGKRIYDGKRWLVVTNV